MSGESSVAPAPATGAGIVRDAAFRFVAAFVTLFILTLPFPYHVLPSPGASMSPWSEAVARWVGDNVLHIGSRYTAAVLSDSTGMYIHALVLLVLSAAIAIAWSLIAGRRGDPPALRRAFRSAVACYLSLQLFTYGFDKLFKHQFYLPEPNILYTPLGHLSRDILYWSTMGASYGYTVFTGAIEVIAALLLLSRRARVPGGMLATAAVAHIVAINMGFDISVKLYSCFLLLLCLVVARPGFVALFDLFILGRNVDGRRPWPRIVSGGKLLLYSASKALVIVAILFESLFPHFRAGDFDDDRAPRPFLHGAYDVDASVGAGSVMSRLSGGEAIRRIFIHRRGYLIVQSASDRMRDHRLEYDRAHRVLIIDPHADSAMALEYLLADDDSSLTLRARVEGDSLLIHARRIDLNRLPLLGPSFHWTIDDYR